MGETRKQGIDAARLAMAFAVALLHALPRPNQDGAPMWAFVAACLCRAAVPFFLIVSGYFLKVAGRSVGQLSLDPFKRLLPLYVAWFVFYAAFGYVRTGQIHVGVRDLLTGGQGLHLWFLPALAVGLCIVGASLRIFGGRGAFAICAFLAACSLAFGGYHEAIGLPEIPGQRLLMAPLYVWLGYAFAQSRRQLSLPVAGAITVLSAVALILEESGIARAVHAQPISHDFMLSTIPLGVGAFMVALAIQNRSGLSTLARLGRLALGIYAAHLAFVWLAAPVVGKGGLLPCLAIACFAFVGGLLTSRILAANSRTAFLVAR